MSPSYTPPRPFEPEDAIPLSDAERALIDRTMALFAKPDEGVAIPVSGPTYDEFIASLPD